MSGRTSRLLPNDLTSLSSVVVLLSNLQMDHEGRVDHVASDTPEVLPNLVS